MLSNIYEFFWIVPKEPIEQFIEKHFYKLNGRIYITHIEKSRILMALEWDKKTEIDLENNPKTINVSSAECVKMKGFLKEQGADIIEITDLIQIKQQTLSRTPIYGKSSL
jgi:hypothetical protein